MNVPQLCESFETIFGEEPDLVSRAPGRVNLIGEHIDYNGGYVLPIAIDKQFLIAGKKRQDKNVRLRSLQTEETYQTELPISKAVSHAWVNYALGVMYEFQELGMEPPGVDLLITSDVPVGSGLSSSAAFEVAVAMLLKEYMQLELSNLEIAQLCQRAENRYVGVNCGLMDQAASACCKKDHALLLDCAAPSYTWHSLPDAAFVVAHSGVKRGLSASAYNERRSQCQQALERINAHFDSGYPHLCAVPFDRLGDLPTVLDDLLFRRARHAISEMHRVKKTIELFQSGDLQSAGELLNQCHLSLRDDYEVSCDELDELTGLCRKFDGVYGSRLTGAGFGGCVITMVAPAEAEKLVNHLQSVYYAAKNIEPIVFTTTPADGAALISTL